MTTQAERIRAVEVRLEKLEQKVDNIDSKLDDLLELKYKGMGAFWLASAIVGTGIASLLWAAFQYIFRGN